MLISFLNRLNNTYLKSYYYVQDLIRVSDTPVYWFKEKINFGDLLSPIILSFLTTKNIYHVYNKYSNRKHLLALGSILHESNSNSIVWGSGFISSDSTWKSAPKKIYAVRGPMTRKKIIDLNQECPKVYGDPALLMPMFYYPKINKKYEIGIVPHFIDKNNNWINKISSSKPNKIKVIDVQNKNPLIIISEILECECIISSSLHGLIISDAYKIPSLWVKFSEQIIGGNFKFNDYYLSFERSKRIPIKIDNYTKIEDLVKKVDLKKINLDLDNLINSFPTI